MKSRILQWLTPLDFEQRHAVILSSRSPGTGDWIIQDQVYQSWVTSEKNQTLWLQGFLGAGKTVLTSVAIDNLRKTKRPVDIAVSYIYCYPKDDGRQSLENIMSVIFKGVVRSKPLSSDLEQFYNDRKDSGVRPSLSDLLYMLRLETDKVPVVFTVIDALDDCFEKDNEMDALLAVLSDIAPLMNIMVTSGPHMNLQRRLPNIKRLEVAAKSQDIRRYVENRLSSSHFTTLIANNDDLRKNIIETVDNKSKGSFSLPLYHMNLLEDSPTKLDLVQTLKNLPSSEDGTFSEILDRIQRQPDKARKTATRILQWLTNVRRPITILELQHALAVEEGKGSLNPDGLMDHAYILSVCKGLVTMDEEMYKILPEFYENFRYPHIEYPDEVSSTIVRLVHYSAESYLESSSQFNSAQVQVEIAKTCLTYLSFTVFETLDRWDLFMKDYPFYYYAASSWGEHARGEPEKSLQQNIDRFLGDEAKFALSTWTLDVRSRHRRPLPILARFGLGFTIENSSAGLLKKDLVDPEKFAVALDSATYRGYFQVAELLIRSSPTSKFPRSVFREALRSASFRGNLEIVKMLILAGANVNGRYSPYIGLLLVPPPLCSACKMEHADVVDFLLNKGANLNEQGCPALPLEIAARQGYTSIARKLLAHGANVKQ